MKTPGIFIYITTLQSKSPRRNPPRAHNARYHLSLSVQDTDLISLNAAYVRPYCYFRREARECIHAGSRYLLSPNGDSLQLAHKRYFFPSKHLTITDMITHYSTFVNVIIMNFLFSYHSALLLFQGEH